MTKVKTELYAIVGTYTEGDGQELETEWLLIARDKYPEYEQSKKLLEAHIHENTDIEYEDFDVVDCWTNRYSEVDGYKVTLVKE